MNPEISEYLLKALSEVFGTGVLVFVGCMGCVFGLGETRDAALLNTGVAFGLGVLISVQAFGCISQAHINPCVTVVCLILNLISIPMACVYVVAQVVGAILGFGVLKCVTPDFIVSNSFSGLCTCTLHPSISIVQGIFVEFMITGFLAIVVCGAFHPRNSANFDSVPVRFGMTVWVLALVAAPYTGASMNPARSLAPAFWNGYYTNLWVYWVGPLSGAIVFAIIYKIAFMRFVPPPPKFIADDNAPEL